MKNTFLTLVVFAGFGCATSNPDLRPADQEETHDRIHVEIAPRTEEQNAFDVAISLRRHESSVSTENRDGYSRRDGQTMMSFPRFAVRSGDEAEISIGANTAQVSINDEGSTVWYVATFLTEGGTISAAGTLDLGANKSLDSTE